MSRVEFCTTRGREAVQVEPHLRTCTFMKGFDCRLADAMIFTDSRFDQHLGLFNRPAQFTRLCTIGFAIYLTLDPDLS